MDVFSPPRSPTFAFPSVVKASEANHIANRIESACSSATPSWDDDRSDGSDDDDVGAQFSGEAGFALLPWLLSAFSRA
jgi:hypothetical protein